MRGAAHRNDGENDSRSCPFTGRSASLETHPARKKLYSPGLTAGRGQPLQRLHLHLAVDEQARRRDALADILRQPGSSSSIDQIDSGRALPEEAGSPASGFWCIVAGRVFQPEGFVIALETAG